MRIVLCIALLLIAVPSVADEFKPGLPQICTPARIAPGMRGEIDRQKLVGQLLKNVGLSEIDLDTEGGEVTFAMKREAIVNPLFCKTVRACSDDARDKLGVAFDRLKRFIVANNKSSDGGPGYEIVRTRGDIRGDITPRELMDATFLGVSAKCVVPKKTGNQAQEGQDGRGKTASGRKDDDGIPPIEVMVRKKVDDLKFSQSSDGFKGLDRASFSFTSDYLKDSFTYNVDGVVGVGTRKFSLNRAVDADLVAYALYTRQFVAGQVPKGTKDVHNIGVGIADNFHIDASSSAHLVQLSSQYVQSQVSEGKIWLAGLSYTPLTGPFIGRAEYFGPFALVLMPYLKFVHGQVVDHGRDPTFVANKAFDRAGGHLELLIVFDSIEPALSWLKGFSWRNVYDYYYGMSGYYRSIDRFQSTVSYKFPDQQFWSVDLSYVSGRNLDTLEFQQQLTLGVGFKY